MSMNELFGAAGAKPKLITTYTSGTGTYVPTENNARCLVRLQGGGGGGAPSTTNNGGGGGAFVEAFVRVPTAGLAYAVGAGGAANAAGSVTTFGKLFAPGGAPGAAGALPGRGGLLGLSYGAVTADAATMSVSSNLSGISGGCGGGAASSGGRAGYPACNLTTNWVATGANAATTNGQGNGSGGDSFYGTGGTSANSPAAGNYGAGGGYNAAGLGGYIEIWDFGA